MGVNGRVPPGPDRYTNLLNAERRVEPVLDHYLLSQFELSRYWDVDDDLDPDKMWYAWLEGWRHTRCRWDLGADSVIASTGLT